MDFVRLYSYCFNLSLHVYLFFLSTTVWVTDLTSRRVAFRVASHAEFFFSAFCFDEIGLRLMIVFVISPLRSIRLFHHYELKAFCHFNCRR